MAEYVKKDDVLAILRDLWRGTYKGIPVYSEEIVKAVKDVCAIPAADVAPVRHGRWIFEPDGGTRCSECNKRVRDVTGGLNEPVDLSELPYCPKCGAKTE